MTFSIEFSKRLIEAAESFFAIPNNTADEAARAVLYLSLVSCEISLKALLEQAGFPIKEIKKRSHNLAGLLEDFSACELSKPSHNSARSPASILRANNVTISTGQTKTVGDLLEAEKKGASKYPNEIRYSDLVQHYPPEFMLECAKVLNAWAKKNMRGINRVR